MAVKINLHYAFDLSFKKFTKTIEVKQLKVGRKSHDEIFFFFLQCMLATIIGTPRNSYE